MPETCKSCGAPLPDGAPFCPVCQMAVGGRSLPACSPDAGPCLVVSEPGQIDRTVPLEATVCGIGRDSANQVVIYNDSVSRRHARVERRPDGYWLTDLGSTNGTSINGRRVEPNAAFRLGDGDIIRIGDQRGNSVGLTFHLGPRQAGRQDTIRLNRFRDLAGLSSFTVGRDPANQVHLNHPSVSRRHARLDQTAGGHRVTDLNSTNGTFLNGKRLSRPAEIRAGDVLQIGPFKLVYEQDGLAKYAPEGAYRLDGLGLVRKVVPPGTSWFARTLGKRPPAKLILNDVSLAICPHEFVALVGSSGAGKSTLLKALCGFAPAQQGRVLINGDDLYANYGAYETIFGYVPQDDIIHLGLVVRDALTYAARLRLPDASAEEITHRVDDALELVEMTPHAGKMVNRLSGGQRKRVSIAAELLAEPGLFFLDEPTSGLDPGLEKKMMYTLRKLADGGRTVVLVTHATANITQCTHVAFMADGRLAFFGPPAEALAFFGTTDFADIYTRLTQPLHPEHNPPPPGWEGLPGAQPTAAEAWEDCFRSSSYYQRHVAARISNPEAGMQSTSAVAPRLRPRVSALQQFGVLAGRYFNVLRRDTLSLFILMAVMPILGGFLLLMSHEHDLTGDALPLAADPFAALQAQRLVFMLALAANLLGIFAAAYEIIKEQAIYRRERMVNLRIFSYLLSKVVVLGCFALVQCALLLVVLWLKVRYPQHGLFLSPVLELYLTLVLTTLASLCLGLLISALASSSEMVVYLILLVLFVQIIFAGAIFPLDNSVQLITDLSTTHWSLQALGSIIALPSQGFSVDYNHDLDHVLKPWAILVAFAVACLVLTVLVQKRKDTV